MTPAVSRTDADLVAASRSGDRDAFGEVVERYQNLVCSLAYSAFGSVAQSEDVAQDTFVAAWKQLGQLREPTKLRGWLCGIARNRINQSLDRQQREPSHAAEPIETAFAASTDDPWPSDRAITRDEEAMVWRALERIPTAYREPLVLFYREGHSVERVAASLEISEDAAKQRLSRGRKLLQDEVAGFIDGALRHTAPSRAFTANVLTALPVLAAPAAGGSAAATLAKGGTIVKGAGAATLATAILAPIAGIVSAWLARKMQMENAESERERAFVARMFQMIWTAVLVLLVVLFGFVFWMIFGPKIPILIPVSILATTVVGYLVALAIIAVRSQRELIRIRREEAARRAPSTKAIAAPSRWSFPPYAYQSQTRLFGLPLVNVRFDCSLEGNSSPVRGWIAIGNYAQGVLFACGGVAIGGLAIGGIAIGPIAIGAMAVGAIALAGLALGGAAIGGLAIGIVAAGGTVVGWVAANGGLSVAYHYAVGGVAHAAHANDAVARDFIATSQFFRLASAASQHVFQLVWIPFVIVALQLLALKRRR